MKSFSIGISIVVGFFLAACSSVSAPQSRDVGGGNEPDVYLVDSAVYTPGEMKELASRNTQLFYVATPEAFEQGQVHVFTEKDDYLNFRRQYTANTEESLTPQTSCWTDLDTKSSLYKNTNYGSSVLKLIKGSRYDKHDLGSFDQAISSVKGACNVWTDLYDGWHFTGTSWSTFGSNYSGLPSWINNDASSVVVGQ